MEWVAIESDFQLVRVSFEPEVLRDGNGHKLICFQCNHAGSIRDADVTLKYEYSDGPPSYAGLCAHHAEIYEPEL